ncbi:MAG: sporulation membrane protein YtaF [Clostridiales bacterium]|nr:sporulation membrane protein YtaF [Clostridiales bacterium]
MPLLSMLFLGIAVSFDGFGAGFAYGLRKVHIPLYSLIIICLSSSLSMFVSMVAGNKVAGLFSPQVSSSLGGFMLIGVGLIIVSQSLGRDIFSRRPVKKEQSEGKGFSIFSGVLRHPELADFDSSGVITGKEAMVLGIALAMDAFGAGFGAAMMGFHPLSTAVAVGVSKLFLLTSGILLGKRFARNVASEKAAVFAGLVLVFLGIGHLVA